MKNTTPNATLDETFPLLKPKSSKEYCVRIDRYSIRRYYQVEGEEKIKSEFLFYPSEFGMEEIKELTDTDPKSYWLKKQFKKLIEQGDGTIITKHTSNIKPVESKKPKRIKLKVKNNDKKIRIKYKLRTNG